MEGARLPFVIDPPPIENAIRRIAVFLDLDEEIAATDGVQAPARDEKAVATLDPQPRHHSATLPLSIACSNCAGCTPARNPAKISAPSSAAAKYQSSLFGSPPNDGAICALGWTCSESVSRASISLARMGKRGLSGTSVPKIAARSSTQSSCRVWPRRGPCLTTLCASGRSTISHDSPIAFPGGSCLPKRYSNRRPPQIRSMKSGSKTSGEVGGSFISATRLALGGEFVRQPLQPKLRT